MHLRMPGYYITILDPEVKHPGKKNRRNPTFLFQRLPGSSPARPVRRDGSRIQKTQGFCHFGSLGVCEVAQRPLRAREKLIHRISTMYVDILGVWEF